MSHCSSLSLTVAGKRSEVDCDNRLCVQPVSKKVHQATSYIHARLAASTVRLLQVTIGLSHGGSRGLVDSPESLQLVLYCPVASVQNHADARPGTTPAWLAVIWVGSACPQTPGASSFGICTGTYLVLAAPMVQSSQLPEVPVAWV